MVDYAELLVVGLGFCSLLKLLATRLPCHATAAVPCQPLKTRIGLKSRGQARELKRNPMTEAAGLIGPA